MWEMKARTAAVEAGGWDSMAEPPPVAVAVVVWEIGRIGGAKAAILPTSDDKNVMHPPPKYHININPCLGLKFPKSSQGSQGLSNAKAAPRAAKDALQRQKEPRPGQGKACYAMPKAKAKAISLGDQ
ncbi:hypothetical protein RJ639_037511 [Escallonia herrerae]|uniref:Uncharacterized protein n=1 Tax=Escallonia herrerae TaxID=1293975 RepID=A0AA89B687_9ASTE|nr:hypothetical protein RJ639_037511 [Escallonia herrerae]